MIKPAAMQAHDKLEVVVKAEIHAVLYVDLPSRLACLAIPA